MVPGLKLLDKLDHPVAGQFVRRREEITLGPQNELYFLVEISDQIQGVPKKYP